MDRVKDKAAIVTGAASGIGEATAKLLAREGARVAVLDMDDVNGARVVREISADGGKADFWHLDISREADVAKTFAAIFAKYKKLNILVNNAGITGQIKPSVDMTSEEFDAVLAVNLKGTFFCVKYALPYLKQAGGGSVINVSSILAMIVGPAVAYNITKAAIRHLTKCDASSYAKDKIRFNSVHPGHIITPMFNKNAAGWPGGVQGSIDRISEGIPLGRMGLAEDIANGILFLASDESSYMTGTEMIIDGGAIIA